MEPLPSFPPHRLKLAQHMFAAVVGSVVNTGRASFAPLGFPITVAVPVAGPSDRSFEQGVWSPPPNSLDV